MERTDVPFTHRAIVDLTAKSLYQHRSATTLKRLVPIPPAAVALSTTAVRHLLPVYSALLLIWFQLKCALEEWADGSYTRVNFAAQYLSQYQDILAKWHALGAAKAVRLAILSNWLTTSCM